ncbi:MAG: ribonuclease III [Candidatus Limnocylindrales bacterium]
MDDGEIGGYRFRDRGLLAAALTHSSYLHEHPDEQGLEDFERLEFLGDAVVDLVIGDELYRRYPQATEGELTAMRSQLVSGSPLAQVAQRLGLPDRARLGRGEAETGGRGRVGLGASLFESVVGARYLDDGFAGAQRFVLEVMAGIIDATGAGAVRSPKTVLQEWAQGNGRPLPIYRIVETVGPEHSREFVVEVEVGDLHAQGTGRSKREAQENAAQALLGTA